MKLLRRLVIFLLMAALPAGAIAKTETLVLGGGCFWCLDAGYRLLPGVLNVTCGYAGGSLPHPTYEQVETGRTGHAEVVKVEFDTEKISMAQVLEYFWKVHDPTQVGGQGNDIGTQYRSIILYSSPAQKAAARTSLLEAQKHVSGKIITEVVSLADFWPAEDYHQNYFAKNPDQAYCQMVIRPKVGKLKEFLAKVGLSK